MPTSSGQRSRLDEETNNRDLSRNQVGGSPEGSCALAVESKMKMYLEPQTDVMFVDLCAASPTDRIDVVDVGDQVGFPGQIQVRVNLEKQILYGITIQKFSSFKRSLFWKYRMASVRHALLLLVISIRAGLRLEHPQPALHAW